MKNKAIKGLVCLLAIMFASKGWAVAKEATQGTAGAKKEKTETQTLEVKQAQLEEYVSKEILFIPWGSEKGECGLRVSEMCVQGMETVTVRYGPSKIEVDKEGNIYIWNVEWGKPLEWEPAIKTIHNPYIHKYVKEKITKGKEITERYKYEQSIPLKNDKRKPFLIERFRSEYHYEFIKKKEPTPFAYTYDENEWIVGIRILDKTDKILGEIIFNTYHIKPFNIDEKGNVYFLIDTTGAVCAGSEDWRLEIYKYNKKGSFLAKIKLSTDIGYTSRFSGQRERIKVDKDGNIYQLFPKEDGVHIPKWEVK
jgi:hypothetical protein